jgi:hypothetical protein
MGDRESLQQALRGLVQQLILTPVETSSGPVYEVSGDINLFAAATDLMPSELVEHSARHCELTNQGVMHRDSAEHSARHYAFPLALTGLQLDPRRAARVPDLSNSSDDATMLAPPTETLTLNAANV